MLFKNVHAELWIIETPIGVILRENHERWRRFYAFRVKMLLWRNMTTKPSNLNKTVSLVFTHLNLLWFWRLLANLLLTFIKQLVLSQNHQTGQVIVSSDCRTHLGKDQRQVQSPTRVAWLSNSPGKRSKSGAREPSNCLSPDCHTHLGRLDPPRRGCFHSSQRVRRVRDRSPHRPRSPRTSISPNGPTQS